MTTDIATRNESSGTTVEAQDDEQECIAVSREWVESVESRLSEQSDRINDLEKHVSEQEDTIQEQDARIEALSKAKNHSRERIDDVEDQLEDHEPTGETDESGSADLYSTPETPLEQITALPEHMAVDSLTANQQRARFIVKDVRQYAEKRLGDWVLSSKDIKKVLSARDGGSTHWTTVNRVIEFLTDMGSNEVREKTKHGRIVTFSEELVGRLDQQPSSHDVVTADTGMV